MLNWLDKWTEMVVPIVLSLFVLLLLVSLSALIVLGVVRIILWELS